MFNLHNVLILANGGVIGLALPIQLKPQIADIMAFGAINYGKPPRSVAQY